MKFILLALAALTLSGAPLFPNFSIDGQSIKGSDFIGTQLSPTGGRYLFALEDQLCPACDFDYNDVYGEIIVGEGFVNLLSVHGLGAYFSSGTAGFAGTTYISGILQLVFNTPSGQMFSGTQQVLLYRLDSSVGVPEPSTYALAGSSLLVLFFLRRHSRRGTIGS